MARRPPPARPTAAGRVIFTIASANYLAHAATLMQSVRAWHPAARRVIILADTPYELPAIDLGAELLPCDRLGVARLDNMKLWYTCLEFNTAIKPYAFRYFLGEGAREVVYLDPDIELFAPLDAAFHALSDHSLVLTPHITEPLSDDGQPDDLAILKTGVYNLGFLGVRQDAETERLIEWWARRTFLQCRVDVTAGLFTDQRWMDLAPSFVSRAAILRDPGYNVAYWNVAHRLVQNPAPGQWTVNGSRLVFYHYSGLQPDDPSVFSRYQTRFTVADLGAIASLCDGYRQRLAGNSWPIVSRLPYGYGQFADGRPIEDPMRRWLLRAADDGRLDPLMRLELDPDYFDAADETAGAGGLVITRMMYQLWLDRADLRGVFDIHAPAGLDAYVTWFTGPHARVDPRSVTAALALYGGSLQLPGLDAARVMPPWPPVAAECGPGPARAAGDYLYEDISATIGGETLSLPRHAALLWELRADLRHAYRLSTPEHVQNFIGWAMTAGCLEAGIDASAFSAGFLATQAARSAVTAALDDVPITAALRATRKVALRRDYLNHWEKFPSERLGRLAHGLWFAFVAPRVFGWPASLAAPVRAWFEQPGDIAFAAFTFNRAECALWELRPDLQHLFPLHDPRSCWGFLHWLCTDGLHELQLTLDQFDPRLRRFLTSTSKRLPDIQCVTEMIHLARADLSAAFDMGEEAGRAGLRQWVEDHFAAAYEARPLGAVLCAGQRGPTRTRSAVPVERVRIALVGEVRAASGRGEDVRGAAAALDAVGCRDYVTVDRKSGDILRPDGVVVRPGTKLEVAVAIVHLNADTAVEDWAFLRRHKIHPRRCIGFWAWELEYLPPSWRHAFVFYDEIWASTQFARAAFAREALRPVRPMPMTVSLPTPLTVPHAGRDRRRRLPSRPQAGQQTVFFFMFDFRSYASRKNPEGVIAAFLQAFPAGNEPVRLVIKTQAADAAAAAWRRLQHLATDRRIELRDASVSREALLAMIAQADVFVSLHRSEGFGRGPAEAMLLERPVIATLYSGTADFLSADCAYVVGATMRPVRPDEYPGVAGQSWAEPDIAAAAAYMRRCHEHPKEAIALGRRGALRVQELYNPARVGHAMLSALMVKDEPKAVTGRRVSSAG